MSKLKRSVFSLMILASLFTGVLAGCGPEPTDLTPGTEETMVETGSPEITSEPPVIPPTELAPAVVLSISPETDSWLAVQVQTALETLALESNLTLIVQEVLSSETIPMGTKILVGVGAAPDMTALAAVNPAVQFVAIDQPSAIPGANLSVIGDPIRDEQYQSFMAGYLAALISTDFKVAGLLASDAATTTEAVNAFVIGARFFCGLCNPKFPPYSSFPNWETLPVASGSSAYQPVVDAWVNMGVEVVYVHQPLVTSDLLGYLAGSGVKVVGGASPDVPRMNWVGTVVSNPVTALINFWPQLVIGQGGMSAPASVSLRDTDSGLLSEGRKLVFEEMLTDLESGIISPEFTP